MYGDFGAGIPFEGDCPLRDREDVSRNLSHEVCKSISNATLTNER
ncbi:unnamed protein product [Protopolystoma xenopodis]|uniref:Uncharacterized protein n=1 Tax=Protopolystoma xenopodis TaxID=117903 RepID=A0A448XA22_9PLAT|nr:unnamed protein product [Protopolystoma xenopodis]